MVEANGEYETNTSLLSVFALLGRRVSRLSEAPQAPYVMQEGNNHPFAEPRPASPIKDGPLNR